MQDATHIALFRGKNIRKVVFENEWWFVLEDIVLALTESKDSKQYLQKMKQRDPELDKGWVQFVRTLEITTDGGKQKMNCANTESLFRIIQSIPSLKAEPFKMWLAKVGYERVQEIEDPELATKRARALYRAKGYSDEWIEMRLRGIAIREDLTSEWDERGAEHPSDYELLTAEISRATFDVTPHEHKNIKGLSRQNLRDHMDNFELIFTMLGESATTEIHRVENSLGVPKLKSDANAGGTIAGDARRALEKRIGRPVVNKQNFLKQQQNKKLTKKRDR